MIKNKFFINIKARLKETLTYLLLRHLFYDFHGNYVGQKTVQIKIVIFAFISTQNKTLITVVTFMDYQSLFPDWYDVIFITR